MFHAQKVGADFPRKALTASLALHVAVVGWLCWQPEPPIISQSSVMAGQEGSSLGIVYLPTDASLKIPVNEESHSLKAPAPKTRRAKPQHVAPHQTDEHPTDAKVQGTSAGSLQGDANVGSMYGSAALPALPLNFPDPHVRASELPPGVTGDVIVEVTIDSAGNIVKKKILQSIGYGIDEKVLSVLENWRFRPATYNGLPVASRQDVHFHFPS